MKNKLVKATLILMALFFILTLMAFAASPAKFNLTPIILEDAGEKVEISIDDIGKYHGHLCPCSGMAFRAAKFSISELWGDEIPKREDLKIISHLPTVGSADCFSYLTGTGPAVPHQVEGEFDLILPDGTEVTDFSPKNLKPISKDMNIDNWNFVIVRKSTGERFEVQLKKDIFPKRFFKLRKMVKFTKTVTDEEKKEFKSLWNKILDAALTQQDNKLFEGKLVAEGPVGEIRQSVHTLKGAVEHIHEQVQVLMPIVKEPGKNKSKIQAVADEIYGHVEEIEDYTGGFHEAVHKLMAANGGPQAETLHDYVHELGYLQKHTYEYVQALMALIKEPEKNKLGIQAAADNIHKNVEEFEELMEDINELLEKL